jgi:hypothetical protein
MKWPMVAFLGCVVLVVLFIALHDWVPLGKLSNPAALRAADHRNRTTTPIQRDLSSPHGWRGVARTA